MIKSFTPSLWALKYKMRQRGPVVRALDLQFGGPEFKALPDRSLDLFMVVPSSNPVSYTHLTLPTIYSV